MSQKMPSYLKIIQSYYCLKDIYGVESDENGLDKKDFISTSDVKRVTAKLDSDKI